MDNSTTLSPEGERRLLLITYEFSYGMFSGNGVLARSLVKSLLRHGCHMTVWCCRPPTHDRDAAICNDTHDAPLAVPELTQAQVDRLQIHAVTLEKADKWCRLDEGSAWDEFTWDQLPQDSRDALTASLLTSNSLDAILVIDWTGFHAFESMMTAGLTLPTSLLEAPLVYMNFRVYSSGIADPQKHAWYDEKELWALRRASVVVALSEKDRISLADLLGKSNKENGGACTTVTTATNHNHNDDDDNNHNQNFPPMEILYPPLRGDVEALALLPSYEDLVEQHLPPEAAAALAQLPQQHQRQRCFISCVVRLSPEKDTLRFVRVIQALLQKYNPQQQQQQWIPLLAGSTSDPEYAQHVKEALRQVCPSAVIVESFLPPAALAAIFARTRLNVHTCAYDAYGMTLMEAAAFGVPSVIASSGHVGASVHVANGASIEVPLEQGDQISEQAMAHIVSVLENPTQIEALGQEARKRALAWDEEAYGDALLKVVDRQCPAAVGCFNKVNSM